MPNARLGPDGELASETLQTLGLLIPGDAASQAWFNEIAQGGEIDPQAGDQYPTASRRVFEYKYWRERLLALETELNESSGAGVFSYWRDRRNPRQRAAFWLTAFGVVVALLALIFTFWSAIEAELTRQQSVIANSAGKANETSKSSNSNLPASITSAPVYVHYPFSFLIPYNLCRVAN
jgi:hypothetical protein